jgi:hypothetical protein
MAFNGKWASSAMIAWVVDIDTCGGHIMNSSAMLSDHLK